MTAPPDGALRAQLEGALAGAYTIERELPRGGMSRVFAATENAFGRLVVLKVFSPELAATLSAERFKREIRLAARLQHPHIVPLLNAGQVGESLYYSMPFVEGELLRDRMRRERQLPFADVARILEEVSSALDFAHAQGVVHRDIKPENIMFFHGQAVVMDFGIAKAVSASAVSGADSGRITRAGMSLGTPTYIAPEQAAADDSLDHRADLYALGVVAYEMLTGHPPFRGKTPQQVIAAHATQAPQPVGDSRPGIPPFLSKVVMQCLEKSPDDRPKSAGEIARAMDDAAAVGSRASGSFMARVPMWVPWVIAAVTTAVAVGLGIWEMTRRS